MPGDPNPYEIMAAAYSPQGKADLVKKYPHYREQVYGKTKKAKGKKKAKK